tara:strand:- start:1250 stop:1498 length:249 start_codon:yes stop_codon:yes gene_type:complete
LGRKRAFTNSPRIIDLDILLWGDLRIETTSLTIPHPRIQERGFVLAPLLEIEPSIVHPYYGVSLKDFYDLIPDVDKPSKIAV